MDDRKKRFMTFQEILYSGVGRYLSTEQYKKANLEIVHNTSEEIDDAMQEMFERLQGTWGMTAEDEDLQERVWAIFEPNDINRLFLAHIGTDFLKQNVELLE